MFSFMAGSFGGAGRARGVGLVDGFQPTGPRPSRSRHGPDPPDPATGLANDRRGEKDRPAAASGKSRA